MVSHLMIKVFKPFLVYFVHSGRVCSNFIDLHACVSVLMSQSPLHLSTPVRSD